MSMIEVLLPSVSVIVTCGSDELCMEAEELLGAQFKEARNLTIHNIPSVELWLGTWDLCL